MECPTVIPRAVSRCAVHEVLLERGRGSSAARGYGAEHQRLRREVLERDGYICQMRRPGCTVFAMTANHKVPLAANGVTSLDNLEAACVSCNSGKRDRV